MAQLYAVWTIKQYLVWFDSHVGSSVDSQYVDYNDTVAKPADPTRSGYIFEGRYEDPECTKKWNFGTMKVNAVDTIYARWLFIYTVTFDGRNAITQPVPASKVAVEGETVDTLPTAPTKTGCTFAGCYTGIVGNGHEFTSTRSSRMARAKRCCVCRIGKLPGSQRIQLGRDNNRKQDRKIFSNKNRMAYKLFRWKRGL